MPNTADDPRIDPRLKQMLAAIPPMQNPGDATSREQLVEAANSAAGLAQVAQLEAIFEGVDAEPVAPQSGLSVSKRTAISQPDGNMVNLQVIRPESEDVLPCIYYIHGGGMQTMSCFYGNYRAWGKIIASNDVVVVMIDFRKLFVAIVCTGDCALSGWSERLRFRSSAPTRTREPIEVRSGQHHRCRGEWRWKFDVSDRHATLEGRRRRPY